ncbi:MAG: hypothetical protein ACLP22_11635 [Solirubrobacteraceae bacterium]
MRAVVVLAATVVALAGAPAASADSLSLSVSPGDPTDSSGVTVTASGTVDDPSGGGIVVLYSSSDQASSCPAIPANDSVGQSISPNATGVQGAFGPLQGTAQPLPLGTYLLCGWITDNSTGMPSTQPVSTTFTVTAADTIALAAPEDAIEGQAFDIDVSGDAYDASAVIDATYKPPGGACAPTPAADTGTVTASSLGPGGDPAYTTTAASQLQLDAGSYLACVWLLDAPSGAVLAHDSAVFAVHTLGATVALRFPARVDAGEEIPVNASADLPANVSTTVVVDVLQTGTGTQCASNPDAEPTSVVQVLSESLTDTQVPSGSVSTSDGEASFNNPGTYLVCAWLLNGWSSATHPATVAGPSTGTITALAPMVYRGRTSRRYPIAVTVEPAEGLVSVISFTARVHCDGTPLLTNGQIWNRMLAGPIYFGTGQIPAIHIRGASFSTDVQHILTVSGHAHGLTITGAFTEGGPVSRFTGNTSQHFDCTTGRTLFTVRAH